MTLCLAMSACIEDAELMEEPDLMTTTTASVSPGQVTLTSNIGNQPYCNADSQRGFILTRRTIDGKTETEDWPVESPEFSLTLTEDLWGDLTCEAYAYAATEGRRYRSRTTTFQPQGGATPSVTGMRIVPDSPTTVTGQVTVYGQHLSKFPFGTSIRINRELEGKVSFVPKHCSHDSIVFDYICCNIGTWDMAFEVYGNRFELKEPLVIDDATLQLGPSVYAGMPNRIGIELREGEYSNVRCSLVNQYELTTFCDHSNGNEWYGTFTGRVGQVHEVSVCYTWKGYDIYFQPVRVNYANAWQRVEGQAVSNFPQNVIGGYGWRLNGGWNEAGYGIRLIRTDFDTSTEKTYYAPTKEGEDGMSHMLGYFRDYNVFGDAEGDKVYCAAYVGLEGESEDDPYSWAFGLQRIRLYEFDIKEETWSWLYDLPTKGSQEDNGYQIWSKQGDRFYYVNYETGTFGWWDSQSGELVSQQHDYLKAHYNDHIGSDERGFYFLVNDLYRVNYDDASKWQMAVPDLVYDLFRAGPHNEYLYGQNERYGGTYSVRAGRLLNSKLMCSSPLDNPGNRTYYGTPDGVTGYALYPVGNEIYCITNDGQVWLSATSMTSSATWPQRQ